MNPITNNAQYRIAIIGGGMGGLTLARLLQQKNLNVTVYERDTNVNARVQGAPLDLHAESGMAAIYKAGLIEPFKAHFMPTADRKKIMNEAADVFFSDHDDKPAENFGDEGFRPEIDRGDLRKILLESLAPDTVQWDSQFIDMQPQVDGWQIRFKNGNTAYADLVIAADGANSKIRPYLTDIKAFYTGIFMLEGNIANASQQAPNIAEMLAGGKLMAFGKSKNILMGQKAHDEIGYYLSIPIEEDWVKNNTVDFGDRQQVLDWFLQHYPEWDSLWQELFTHAMLPFIPRPIYCMPTDQTWQAQPNLTMIGDAAHVMPPFAGEGVNMAMLDALELSEILTDPDQPNLQTAIETFENNMRPRAAKIAQYSLDNGVKMHSETALQNMLAFFNQH